MVGAKVVAGEDAAADAAAEERQEVPTPAEEGEEAAEAKPEEGRIVKMNVMSTPKPITVKMTMTKRRAYLSPRSTTITVTITIIGPMNVVTHFLPPAGGSPVDVIPSVPDATT